MSARFDRESAGEGIEVKCRMENGKALLEWSFHYENDDPGQECFLRLRMKDGEGHLVLECYQQTGEEEPLESVLLHPCLWQSTENPCLYRLEAEILSQSGKQVDKYVRLLSLYVLEYLPGKGIMLNGTAFSPKTVRYRLPEESRTAQGQRLLLQDMQRIRELGANGIYLEAAEGENRSFLQLCERLGLLVWGTENAAPGNYGSLPGTEEKPENLPLFRGEPGSFVKEDGTFTSQYYRYRARWSKTPFVYIVPESIRQQENGSFTVSVYSSCKKVALYLNGILHEFQSGREEFVFRGINVQGPCLILTAEAEECAHSLSIHKTFTKLSLFHDI